MRTSRSWLPSYANRGISRRAFLRASAAGAGGAFLLACGGGDGGSAFKFDDAATSRQPGTVWRTENDYKLADESKEAVRGGIYRGLETADMSGHFDAIALMGSEIPFSYHMYEQLTQRNRRPGVDPASKEGYFAVPALAENWEFADAGLTVTFTLRKNVKFHNIAPVNGRAMDIDDWRTSTQRHQQIGVYRNFMNSVVDKVEYPDATHMVWRMKHPYAPLYEVLPIAEWGYPIQPKELNADPDLARRVAVGTGFKILDKLQPSITHEYRKFSEYWGGDPFIERWHFPIIPEYSNRYAQFVSGNITNFTPTARDVLQVAKDVPGAVIVADPPDRRRASRYLFGIDRPANDPYNDPRVRIAMRRSVDFKSIGEFLSNKQAFDAAGIAIELTPMTHLPQNSAYWLNPEKGELGDLSKNYLFDQAEARKLLQAAGHTSPLLLNMANQTSGTNVLDPSALMVDNLKLAGIWNVNVIQNASAAAQNLYRIERTSDAIVWSSGSDSEPDYLIARDWSNTYRPDGRTAFQNQKTEDLLRLQREALDFGKRVEVLKDIQRWGAEWMMVVPAQHIFTTFSFRWPWVHNSNWGGEDGQPYWGGHYWWLDPAMPRREQGAA